VEEDVEIEERAQVRTDELTPGAVILAVKNPVHDPAWRKVEAVYEHNVPFGDKPGETQNRWQIWFADAEYPMGLIVYGGDRSWPLGTEADLGTEVPR
jgi:hypothetical protein